MRLLLLLTSCSLLVASELPPPTAEEVYALDLINRFRADPPGRSEWVLRWTTLGLPGQVLQVDWDACRQELRALPAAPPLVFNLRLQAAARGHAIYLHEHGRTGHQQDPDTRFFTGVNAKERVRVAGYRGIFRGENAFTNTRGAINAVQGYLIDWGGGPDGLLPGRGHRHGLMDPHAREIGNALVAHGRGFFSSVQVFGFGDRRRRPIGGVIYRDHDGDGTFDPGEGIADARIRFDGAEIGRSWSSGGFAVQAPVAAGRLAIVVGEENTQLYELPAGDTAVYIDRLLPTAAQRRRAAADYARLTAETDPRQRVDLRFGLHKRHLDDAQAATLDELSPVAETKELQEGLRQARRALYHESLASTKRQLRQLRQLATTGAIATWTEEAGKLAPVWWRAVHFMRAVRARQPVGAGDKRRLLRAFKNLQRRLTVAEFRDACAHADNLLATLGRRP